MTDVRGVRIVCGELGEDLDGELCCCEYTKVDDGIRMSSLQFLDAEGDLMERILTKASSPNLKWLRWTDSEISLPLSIHMKNLRALQIEGDRLKTLWEEELGEPDEAGMARAGLMSTMQIRRK